MKRFILISIQVFIFQFTFGQIESEVTILSEFEKAFDSAVRVDSMISQDKIKLIHGDGEWGFSSDYYSNNQLVKESYTEFHENGLLEVEQYKNNTGANSLARIRYSENGCVELEIMLVSTKSGIIEIKIKGAAEEHQDWISKIKQEFVNRL